MVHRRSMGFRHRLKKAYTYGREGRREKEYHLTPRSFVAWSHKTS